MALDIRDSVQRSPVYNDNGLVAMRYIRQNRMLVNCGPPKDQRGYVFEPRFNVYMSWVEERDVECCLAVKGGCCGSKRPGVIIFASESDIVLWTTGKRV